MNLAKNPQFGAINQWAAMDTQKGTVFTNTSGSGTFSSHNLIFDPIETIVWGNTRYLNAFWLRGLMMYIFLMYLEYFQFYQQ